MGSLMTCLCNKCEGLLKNGSEEASPRFAERCKGCSRARVPVPGQGRRPGAFIKSN